MAVFTSAPDARPPRRDPLGGPLTTLLVVVSLWLAAFCAVLATRVFAALYVPLGTALPAATTLVLDAERLYVPWIAAAVATLLVVALRWWRSPRFALGCASLATLAMLGLCTALLALALPFAPCGELMRLWASPAAEGGCTP